MENKIISKELLEEVMGKKVALFNVFSDEVLYRENSINNPWTERVNIHELAHKCKEWAILKKYDFTILIDNIDIFKNGIRVHSLQNMNQHDNFIPFDPFYDIKACEWIRKELSK